MGHNKNEELKQKIIDYNELQENFQHSVSKCSDLMIKNEDFEKEIEENQNVMKEKNEEIEKMKEIISSLTRDFNLQATELTEQAHFLINETAEKEDIEKKLSLKIQDEASLKIELQNV